ncbi:ornithine cyclodeaminase family protein [Rummeliibacillus sp. JY-2-4R]
MLILNDTDISKSISMQEVIQAIEEAYELCELNDFNMPMRNQIQDHNNSMLLMPCFAKDSSGIKIINVNPNNREYPVTQGVMMLHDRQSGALKGIINGTVLTGMRTGAIGGVAIKYLANEDATSVGLIGTGFQGFYQLIAACAVKNIKEVYLWNRTSEKLPSFIGNLAKHISQDITIYVVDTPSQLIEQSDIIITSTTSNNPVLDNTKDAFNGKCIIGIGSYQPQMREFSEAIYENLDVLYVDTLDAIKESGDIIDPLLHQWLETSQIIPFSKVITQKVKPSFSAHRPTVFKSTGMALFDLIVANRIFEQAIEKQIGQYIYL